MKARRMARVEGSRTVQYEIKKSDEGSDVPKEVRNSP